jgi:hypothetical protein
MAQSKPRTNWKLLANKEAARADKAEAELRKKQAKRTGWEITMLDGSQTIVYGNKDLFTIVDDLGKSSWIKGSLAADGDREQVAFRTSQIQLIKKVYPLSQ